MSDLSAERLKELTDLINERISEWGMSAPRLSLGAACAAHDVIKRWYEEREESWAMQRISDVKITHQMAMKLSHQGYDVGYEAAKRELFPAPNTYPDGEPRPPLDAFTQAVEDAERQIAEPMSYGAGGAGSMMVREIEAAMRGDTPEPPLVPRYPRTLADVDADEDGDEDEMITTCADKAAATRTLHMNPEDKQAQFREILGALQDMAVDNAMPGMNDWNHKRPDHLPKGVTICNQYDVLWSDLARMAHLKMQFRPGRPSGRKRAADSQKQDDEKG